MWLATLGLAGCGHAPARTGLVVPPAIPYQNNLLAADIAASMIGTRYRAGGDGPREGFDCSGLVRYSYGLVGLALPRTADEQQAVTEPVKEGALAVGDLLFFRINGAISHVGIYYGDGEFVHAPSSGKAVMRSRLDDPYWRAHLDACGRPLPGLQDSAGNSPRSSSGVLTSAGRSAAATGALSRNP